MGTSGPSRADHPEGVIGARQLPLSHLLTINFLHPHIMASTYQMTESAISISDAITALNEGFYSTLTAAAKAHNVTLRTVQRRLQGIGSRSSRSSRTLPNRALNPEQEQAIRNYLKRLDNAGISAPFSMLRGAANYLLKRSHLHPCTLLPP